MAIAFSKGITFTGPGISTTTTTSSNSVEIESFSIDYGSQEFEDNNDIARNDDYIQQEKTAKRYGTLKVSGKGHFPDASNPTVGLGAYGPITISNGASTVYTAYGVVQNYTNDLNARQKPTFSVTYQIVPQDASYSESSSSSSSSSSSGNGEG